jgi:hypothetical protein
VERKCHQCEATEDTVRLRKCPICFQFFCDEHGYSMSGRSFCGPRCAEYFFFSDPDEEDDE